VERHGAWRWSVESVRNDVRRVAAEHGRTEVGVREFCPLVEEDEGKVGKKVCRPPKETRPTPEAEALDVFVPPGKQIIFLSLNAFFIIS
jgi:hypothetical protein